MVGVVGDSDFWLLMTEPAPFDFNDLALAVDMFDELDVTCDIVIDRNSVGDNKTEEYCLKQGVPISLRIPIDIARLFS